MAAGHHGRVAVDSGLRLKPGVIGGRMHRFISDEGGLRFTRLNKGTPCCPTGWTRNRLPASSVTFVAMPRRPS